jgi:2-polyprenyl-3-methyl-5-hydroxy-6-metoxy-1,4-benzoquinol methylase
MLRPVACALCGSEQATPLFATHDRLLDLPDRFRFVRCTQCGLIYVNPQPTWAKRRTHYPPGYRGYDAWASQQGKLQRRGMAFGFAKRYRIIAAHVPSGRLLDIGCGNGDFLTWMQQQPGWQVYGLERNAAIMAAGLLNHSLPFTAGDVMRLGFSADTFDVVTLWSVLEHLANPAQGLRECARVLRPGGLLVVRTVTVDSWGGRLFGAAWVGYDAPRVLYVFSRDTLQQLLIKTGFELLVTGSYFHDFHPFLWSWRNLCREQFGATRLCDWLDQVAHSWLARGLTFPFFALQTWLGGNSFVTAVARKR